MVNFFEERKDQFSCSSCKRIFRKNRKMYKIFNRNSVKIGCSCMENIGSIISTDIGNILNPIAQSFGCNCRVKTVRIQSECEKIRTRITPNMVTFQEVNCSVKSSCPIFDECLTPQKLFADLMFLMAQTTTKNFTLA